MTSRRRSVVQESGILVESVEETEGRLILQNDIEATDVTKLLFDNSRVLLRGKHVKNRRAMIFRKEMSLDAYTCTFTNATFRFPHTQQWRSLVARGDTVHRESHDRLLSAETGTHRFALSISWLTHWRRVWE